MCKKLGFENKYRANGEWDPGGVDDVVINEETLGVARSELARQGGIARGRKLTGKRLSEIARLGGLGKAKKARGG